MEKMKVMTVVGTRPEIIRLSSLIQRLSSCSEIDHVLVHTGQNYDYELNEIFFKDLNINEPDYYLGAATGNPIETIGNILIKIEPILEKVNPDVFCILGDTNSCLSAIAAKRRHIPIFHMEAGNRCFDYRVPEETNRKLVDHLADINLPYSSIAREYLLKESFPSDRIIKTGSPMYEVLSKNRENINNSDILERLGLDKKNYFLVSAHREENINSSNFINLVESINSIAETYQIPIIISTHPRTRKKINENGIILHPLVRMLKPLGFFDYNKLQLESRVVLSDSGTISEESSILKFPALNIRNSHERPEAMEESVVMMVGTLKEKIMRGINILAENNFVPQDVEDYCSLDFSEKVLRIILSYTDYVKENVWKEF